MTRVVEKPVSYNFIPREVFASFDFPGADDLANMFDYYHRFVPNRQADLKHCRALYPKLQTFESWLIANKAKFADILK